MESTKSKETTERLSDDDSFFGPRWGGPSSNRIDDSMVDLHWEIGIEHWVPDDHSRLNRLRWFVWDLVGIGNPPSRAERATAEEVTTVPADSVPILQNLPNRRFVKAVSRNPRGMGSPEESVPFGVLDHS
jgi:hypothetical protein